MAPERQKKYSQDNLYGNIRLHYKLWITNEDDDPILGDGRILLLKEIHQTGSIVAASAKLGVSYRKAWGDIREAEMSLGFSLVDKHRGGESGGTSSLTVEGIRLVELWEEMKAGVEKETEKESPLSPQKLITTCKKC
jgi:molybdate transport system regulatory protein